MLSIKAQKSRVNAVRYFRDHLSRDDYYSDREHTPGYWFGGGCQAVGLDRQAEVRQEDFVALCKGLRADDGTRLTQRASPKRRCLYDLTISAPKSVSIMALLAGDERLIAAHEKAVASTLAAAEKLAAVRVRKGAAVDTRQARVTGNIVCARFTHKESRALDPQLHTHCVTFNVTRDPVERRLKALEARPLYDHAGDLTRRYREHLAESLQGLGYDTYQDRYQCPQIRGVSAAVMARFSKRSAQRDVLVALRERELGRALAKGEVAAVVHRNRAKKQQHVDPQALRRMQLEQLTPEDRLQLDRVKAAAMAGPRPPMLAPPVIAPPVIPSPVPAAALPGSSLPWLSMLRLALLAARAAGFNPYTLHESYSFPQRIYCAARFFQQAQRTRAVMGYMQRSRSQALSR